MQQQNIQQQSPLNIQQIHPNDPNYNQQQQLLRQQQHQQIQQNPQQQQNNPQVCNTGNEGGCRVYFLFKKNIYSSCI